MTENLFLILLTLIFVVDNAMVIYILKNGGFEWNPGMRFLQKHLGVNEALIAVKAALFGVAMYSLPLTEMQMIWALVSWVPFLAWNAVQIVKLQKD